MLTTHAVRSAKTPGIKSIKLFDGGGLYLLVNPRGSKWWRFKYRFGGKENQSSLGVYPDVSLREARKKRNELKKILKSGRNPSEYLRNLRDAQRDAASRMQAAMRFTIDDQGALAIRLGSRRITLSANETADLHTFLQGTSGVFIRGEANAAQ